MRLVAELIDEGFVVAVGLGLVAVEVGVEDGLLQEVFFAGGEGFGADPLAELFVLGHLLGFVDDFEVAVDEVGVGQQVDLLAGPVERIECHRAEVGEGLKRMKGLPLGVEQVDLIEVAEVVVLLDAEAGPVQAVAMGVAPIERAIGLHVADHDRGVHVVDGGEHTRPQERQQLVEEADDRLALPGQVRQLDEDRQGRTVGLAHQ